ncbi:hypothetical protein KI372_11785, partial [Halobacterium salinarum]|nr:hypothetical protein [Halobacterium salinarum]
GVVDERVETGISVGGRPGGGHGWSGCWMVVKLRTAVRVDAVVAKSGSGRVLDARGEGGGRASA